MKFYLFISITLAFTFIVYGISETDAPKKDLNGKIAAESSNQFATDLLDYYIHSEAQKGKNIFFSPFSISTAVSMTAEGARGDTQKEMRAVFHLSAIDSLRQGGFFGLISSLSGQHKNYKLNTSNALWIQKGEKLQADFLNVALQYYLAGVEMVDFKSQPEKSRQTINQFVEEKTEKKIKDLIPEGVIKPETKLVLTNTIYFKAAWENEFKKSNTQLMSFTSGKENKKQVQMMNQTAQFNYFENAQFQVMEMKYKNDETSMLVILPRNEHDFSKIDKKIIETMLHVSMQREEVDLRFPKFKFVTSYFMKETLSKLGMQHAFSNGADFSGITAKERLKISEVIHKAFIEVGEDGTEAAAATAVVIETTSVRFKPQPKTFYADHPFMFVIRHQKTGAILFMGIMNDPN